jgi:hypothetical protein
MPLLRHSEKQAARADQPSSEVLGGTAMRIINEVRGINRVVCNAISKPPGSIEWARGVIEKGRSGIARDKIVRRAKSIIFDNPR